MHVNNVTINEFRNIRSCALSLSNGFNVLAGDNGAGKTSILEAIHTLATGKSFRTHLPSRYIMHDQPACVVTATLITHDQSSQLAGLERNRDGSRQLRLNREPIQTIAPIAKLFPIQNICVDSHRFFSDGPKSRRSFLDWGLFHVEPGFLDISQDFNRVLKQRNAALKSKLSLPDIQVWDESFIRLSNAINDFRTSYINDFNEFFYRVGDLLLPNLPYKLELRFKQGWNKSQTIDDQLAQQIDRDFYYGSTQSGPHRADLQLYANGIPADDVLSQGQLKVASYALHIAQGELLHQKTGCAPVYLIDDLPSELDEEKQGAVMDLLSNIQTQVIITAIDSRFIEKRACRNSISVFHVEQGRAQVTDLSLQFA